MGMQIHFNAADLEAAVTTKTIHDMESDTYTIAVLGGVTNEPIFEFNLIEDSCYFDCARIGYDGDGLIGRKIAFLIHNRICFNAS